MSRAFASDNNAGVHPAVLDAIHAANTDHAPAYGDDPWTRKAVDAVQSAFDCDAEVLFCFGGTGANVIALGAVTRPFEAIIAADSAHVWNDECNAQERFIGAKIIPVSSDHGKIVAADLEPHLTPGRGVHQARPRVLSLTQPTEWGTLYSLEELTALCAFAHDHDMLVHVDGARFANAAVALEAGLAEAAPRCGVDVLSFGGTKNGLLGAEAVVFFQPELARDAAHVRKQTTQLASKMRYLSAQFIAYLEHDLWRTTAAHANAMTARLTAGCATIDGFELACPAPCNLAFPRFPASVLESLLAQYYFYTWDSARHIARWITAFDTTEEDVDALVAGVAAAFAAADSG